MSTEVIKPEAKAEVEFPPYETKRFTMGIEDEEWTFVSIPKFENHRVQKDGKLVTQKNRTDYFIPETKTVDDKFRWLNLVVRMQESREQGTGVQMLDDLIYKLSDAPNEVVLNEDGTTNESAYVEEFHKPLHRTGLSESKVNAEIKECMRVLGELFYITSEKDQTQREEKIRAAGFQDSHGLIGKMDTIQQRIQKLSRTLTDIKQRKADKEEKKKQREAQKAVAAANEAAVRAQK